MTDKLRRGGFARDERTGQVVKVREIGGTDVLVRPAYRSDALWVPKADLHPVRDPHEWGGMELIKVLLLAVVLGLFVSGSYAALDGVEAYPRAVFGGVVPGALGLSVLARWFGLVRD